MGPGAQTSRDPVHHHLPGDSHLSLKLEVQGPLRHLARLANPDETITGYRAMAAAALIPYVLTDDGSDVFAAECRFQQVRLEPVDYLKLLHLAGAA